MDPNDLVLMIAFGLAGRNWEGMVTSSPTMTVLHSRGCTRECVYGKPVRLRFGVEVPVSTRLGAPEWEATEVMNLESTSTWDRRL